jgi:hypothetical protein
MIKKNKRRWAIAISVIDVLTLLTCLFVQTWNSLPDLTTQATPLPYAQATIRIGTAGVPQYLGAHPDYDHLFHNLAQAGITSFFPLFEYQEVPTYQTYGHEVNFLPPCNATSPAFQAMLKYHIKLLVPASLLYADGIPPLTLDPLHALMNCLGRDLIEGVYSFDEPALTETDTQHVQAVYQRVKSIDVTLPVLMVQAPIQFKQTADGSVRSPTRQEVDAYLSKVKVFNRYADVVGFDLYPLAADGYLATPFRPQIQTDYGVILNDYLQWLHEQQPSKPYLMVLQAFSFSWQGDARVHDLIPSGEQIQTMACFAYHGGATQIIWYGAGFQRNQSSHVWDAVLQTSQRIVTSPQPTCS